MLNSEKKILVWDITKKFVPRFTKIVTKRKKLRLLRWYDSIIDKIFGATSNNVNNLSS